ncbi:MAG: transcriptional regulator [Thalassobius sp.]|nr:transcriptional regulator [Thalassovita sp.]
MSYQLELRHLHYFSILAEELHFKKAADRLYISQPGLSKQIKHLEDTLGILLLERTNRKVKLTPAGEYLAKELKLVIQHLDTTLDHTKLIHSGLKGNLKIGYIGSAMQNIIPELLKHISERYPEIRFDLTEMNNNTQIEELLHHKIDLGFVRVDRVPRPLKTQPVFEDTFSVVLPKNHLVTQENFTDLTIFKDEKFILFESSYSQFYYEKVMQLFHDAGFNPQVSHHTIHAGSIYRLVENGFGISIVPTTLQLGYNMDVKFIELKDIVQRTTLAAVWNDENRNPVMENVQKIINEMGI